VTLMKIIMTVSSSRHNLIWEGNPRAEDGKTAVRYNVGGICVSNHGGRQLDTSPSSLNALP
jgi:isopentenyl diphosphate isomerase/L-lactate dehydrogenase-like FMN-dependent dehydrogenase